MAKILQTLLIFLLVSWGVLNAANAQYASSTAFCAKMKGNECAEVIPNGSTVSISSLPIVDGFPAIYFVGIFKNSRETHLAVFFTRQGECYANEPVNPDARALRNLSGSERIWGFIKNLRLRDIWSILGLEGVELGANTVKGKLLVMTESPAYHLHYYRYAHCPGRFSARFLDAEGEPVPGYNDLDIVLVE